MFPGMGLRKSNKASVFGIIWSNSALACNSTLKTARPQHTVFDGMKGLRAHGMAGHWRSLARIAC